ncbi:hypothetical protein PAXRUDRAFT_827021 [Paxillus rubicundulus Ve08.2h10]|uniref:Uncharacterized protein n=1 Tax=Paxillus rubicundulus Ve08.2h10 TaxID=930991 RepID=A0A0D0E3I9_9AGAM|nr:hypothetical protein PAXRUDRAFT_827021 [Paxillus rubicundulus Ve08.2h10]
MYVCTYIRALRLPSRSTPSETGTPRSAASYPSYDISYLKARASPPSQNGNMHIAQVPVVEGRPRLGTIGLRPLGMKFAIWQPTASEIAARHTRRLLLSPHVVLRGINVKPTQLHCRSASTRCL